MRALPQAEETGVSEAHTYVGFEEIGPHSSNVSNVVTNIVRDHSRVARVVLWDIHFNLSDQIGSNVRSLGVDASSNTSEDGNT